MSQQPQPLPPLFAPPLRTQGRYVVDAAGKRFKLAAVNWYGGSDELFVPGGLDVRHRSGIATLIRGMGFNTVRMPYSDEMVMTDPPVPACLVAANPDLAGLGALDVFTACVAALTAAGLAVVVNDHITQARWCDGMSLCDAAWKNDHLGPLCRVRLTEAAWIANWETVMGRLVADPGVVGCDLRNEVRGLWGTMPWSAWAGAAERAADRLHARLSPAWLMIVEGVSSANDLSGARRRPVALAVPHRVVYSAHVFAWSGWGSLSPYSRRPYAAFARAMRRNWAFLLAADADPDAAAPVWVAEMGAPARPDDGTAHYWRNLLRFLRDMDVDFGYWAINPRKPHGDEKETWALVDDTWTEVLDDYRLQDMRTLMAPPPAPAPETTG